MPRVSVIIPVYNVEDYLALSVASVRQQTLEDIEIICVNDGSTDGSREILALLEAVDSRIVVIAMRVLIVRQESTCAFSTPTILWMRGLAGR